MTATGDSAHVRTEGDCQQQLNPAVQPAPEEQPATFWELLVKGAVLAVAIGVCIWLLIVASADIGSGAFFAITAAVCVLLKEIANIVHRSKEGKGFDQLEDIGAFFSLFAVVFGAPAVVAAIQ